MEMLSLDVAVLIYQLAVLMNAVIHVFRMSSVSYCEVNLFKVFKTARIAELALRHRSDVSNYGPHGYSETRYLL